MPEGSYPLVSGANSPGAYSFARSVALSAAGRMVSTVLVPYLKGVVEADQKTKVVEKGASQENVVLKTMTGGKVDSKQEIDEV
jgi:hypothetical protein